MFLRIVKVRGGQGVQHEYVRLVETHREHGKDKQRVVCNLGRKDLLAARLDGLIRFLRRERAQVLVATGSARPRVSRAWPASWRRSPCAMSTADASSRRGATRPRTGQAGFNVSRAKGEA